MNKKYWLRGIVVGVAFYVVIFIMGSLSETVSFFTSVLSPGAWVFVGVGGLNAETKYMIQFIISIFSWAIFGTILGLLYGKIKNRNKNKVELN